MLSEISSATAGLTAGRPVHCCPCTRTSSSATHAPPKQPADTSWRACWFCTCLRIGTKPVAPTLLQTQVVQRCTMPGTPPNYPPSSLPTEFGQQRFFSVENAFVPFVDVFLCHAGEQKELIMHMRKELQGNNITSFLDVASIVTGKNADENIRPAIQNAKVIIQLITLDFIGKDFPMKELRWALEHEYTRVKAVPVLYGLRRDELKGGLSERVKERLKVGAVKVAGDHAEKAISLYNQWSDDLRTVGTLGNIDPSDEYCSLTDADLVSKVVKEVSSKLRPAKAMLPCFVVGLHEANGWVHDCVRQLRLGGGRCAIFGAAGVGKSVVARYIYSQLESDFEVSDAAWLELQVAAPGNPTILDYTNKLLKQLGRKTLEPHLTQPNVSYELRSRNKLLILLDNLWDGAQLSALLSKELERGSVVLCTCRDSDLLLQHGLKQSECHKVCPLLEDDSRQLLRWHAFQKHGNEQQLPEEVLRCEQCLLNVCQGLPRELEKAGHYLLGQLQKMPHSPRITANAFEAALKHMFVGKEQVAEGPRNFLRAREARQLFGRDVEGLLQALSKYRLVQLLGGPGEGKTELAAAVGHMLWVRGGCGAGAYWLDLAGVSSRAKAVQEQVVEQLSYQVHGVTLNSWVDVMMWARRLGEPALVVLDNAECAMGHNNTVQDLQFVQNQLHGSSEQLLMIVASRIAIPEVPSSLSADAVQHLKGLADSDARKLLDSQLQIKRHGSKRCQLGGRDVGPGRDQLGNVAIGTEDALREQQLLVHDVQGNALLLIIAASLMAKRELSWKEVRQRAQHNLLDFHKNPFSAMTSWIKDLLEREAQSFLACLSSFAGSFSEAGALAVQLSVAGEQRGGAATQADIYAAMTPARVDTLQELASLSLVQCLGNRYSLHPLVRQVARSFLESAGQLHAAQFRFLDWMVKQEGGPGQQLQRHQPHENRSTPGWQHDAVLCACILEEEHLNLTELPRLLPDWLAGEAHPGGNDITQGCIWQLTAQRDFNVVSCKMETREERIKWLNCALNSLGQCGLQAKMQGAVLDARMKWLGAQHPNTLRMQHNLANTLHERGELQQAKLMQQEVLDAYIKLLGAEHPYTLTTQRNLAITLRELGERQQAKRMQQEVLDARIKLLGAQHLDTLLMQDDLAITLRELGELQQAKRMQQEVLDARIKLLGAQDLGTLATQNSLAITMRELGEPEQAKHMLQVVLDARIKLLGAEHPFTLGTQGSLASTMQELGELQHAKHMHQKVLDARIKRLGAQHPHTLMAQHNLASTLMELGELEHAKRMQREVLDAYIKLLGTEHPYTLATQHNLAVTLRKLGELQQAKCMLQELLDARIKLLGAQHPDTLGVQYHMGITLRELGELQQAKHMQQELLDAYMKLLGAQHPQTHGTQQHLFITLQALGEL